MSVTKQKMISFLAERYSESVQTRGLWIWADGDPKDIPYLDSPEKHWAELWALAGNEKTQIYPQNLIQEALLDTPGDGFLIDCLVSLSANTSSAIKNNDRLLVEILEHWGEKLEFDSILSSLLVFSDCSIRDGVTVLVPVLDRKIDEEFRDKWEPWFQKIKMEKKTGSIKGIFSLLDLMLDSLMANSPRIDSQKFQMNAPKVKAYLEKVVEGFENLPEDGEAQDLKININEPVKVTPKAEALLNTLIKEFIPLIGSFIEITSQTLKPKPYSAFMGIQRLFELSKNIAGDKKWPWVHDFAEICFKSIWATKPKKKEDETAKNS